MHHVIDDRPIGRKLPLLLAGASSWQFGINPLILGCVIPLLCNVPQPATFE
jgi:hypothetical protein